MCGWFWGAFQRNKTYSFINKPRHREASPCQQARPFEQNKQNRELCLEGRMQAVCSSDRSGITGQSRSSWPPGHQGQVLDRYIWAAEIDIEEEEADLLPLYRSRSTSLDPRLEFVFSELSRWCRYRRIIAFLYYAVRPLSGTWAAQRFRLRLLWGREDRWLLSAPWIYRARQRPILRQTLNTEQRHSGSTRWRPRGNRNIIARDREGDLSVYHYRELARSGGWWWWWRGCSELVWTWKPFQKQGGCPVLVCACGRIRDLGQEWWWKWIGANKLGSWWQCGSTNSRNSGCRYVKDHRYSALTKLTIEGIIWYRRVILWESELCITSCQAC